MRGLAIIAALIAMIAQAAAQRTSLEDYIGQLPSDRVGGRSFIDAVRAAVEPVVGEARWRLIRSYGTASPIEAIEDREFGLVLVAWQCRPHACPEQATIVIGAGGALAGVCFADGRRAQWFGPGWRAPAREPECGFEPAEVLARLRSARARR